MDLEKLFELARPCFYVVGMNQEEFRALEFKLRLFRPRSLIRHIRGGKSKSHHAYFDELAAALQFPLYFGENWNAVKDCLTDLEWCTAESYVILVENAPKLLGESELGEFETCMRLFVVAMDEWLDPNKDWDGGRLPAAFHVVFQCNPSDVQAFAAKLSTVNAEFEILN